MQSCTLWFLLKKKHFLQDTLIRKRLGANMKMGTLCFLLQWSRQDEEEETEGVELGGDLGRGGCADVELL